MVVSVKGAYYAVQCVCIGYKVIQRQAFCTLVLSLMLGAYIRTTVTVVCLSVCYHTSASVQGVFNELNLPVRSLLHSKVLLRISLTGQQINGWPFAIPARKLDNQLLASYTGPWYILLYARLPVPLYILLVHVFDMIALLTTITYSDIGKGRRT